jgi:hypothetical protein
MVSAIFMKAEAARTSSPSGGDHERIAAEAGRKIENPIRRAASTHHQLFAGMQAATSRGGAAKLDAERPFPHQATLSPCDFQSRWILSNHQASLTIKVIQRRRIQPEAQG